MLCGSSEFAFLLSLLRLTGLLHSEPVSMLTAGHEHWDGSRREQGLHLRKQCYIWGFSFVMAYEGVKCMSHLFIRMLLRPS